MMETGVGLQNLLFFIGVVENNLDERLEGRVQVRAFGVHGTNAQVPTESLPWATLIHGSYDPDAALPPVNSFVFGFFIDGRDAQQPMILGLIPTQLLEPIDPEVTGWGAIPERDADLLARGSRPTDIGQPRNSRETRGESIDQSYVLQQEANRRRNIPVASINPDDEDERQEFSEPAPAYNAEYPFNRVIRSGRNTIELDDTPGAERVTIFHHRSGSYISIDVNGTSVYRSMSDTYNINERNYNVYIGGQSIVTVEGDSRVLVKGNKVEEIAGDLIQNVRGNHLLSVAGQMNLNAGEDIQMRGAKVRIEANVENINIKSAKNMNIESKQSTHIKSGIAIFQDAKNSINIKAGDNLFTEIGGSANIKSETMFLTSTGALDLKGGHVKLGGGSKVSVNASLVAIDDIVQLSSGQSAEPAAASEATAADPAESTEMPEPVSRGVSPTAGENTPSLGQAGYASADDPNPTDDLSPSELMDPNINPPADDILTQQTERQSLPQNFVSPGYPPDLSIAEIEQIIREEAILRNIDPSVAIRIFRAEGASAYQSTVRRSGSGSLGGREASFGPYQLFTGGGLGNEYEQRTGRRLVDDNTRGGITNQIRFALDAATRRGGWQPWYGRHPARVGRREGLNGSFPINNWR